MITGRQHCATMTSPTRKHWAWLLAATLFVAPWDLLWAQTVPPITVLSEQTVVQFLMGACTVLGGGLITTLAWVALGVIRRLDEMKRSNDQQYKALQEYAETQFKLFGQQLAGLHDLVMQDLHRHDVRIVRLEEWRKALDKNAPASGD